MTLGEPVSSLFEKAGIPALDLLNDPELVAEQEFDLIWAHHWPVAGFCISELAVRYRYLVYSSLSAFEPLELVSVIEPFADVVVFNSESTKAALLPEIKDIGKTHVMPNSLSDEWFSTIEYSDVRALRKLGIISNHVPSEITDAADLLRNSEIEVTVIGMESKQMLVDKSLVESFDAVITIGHTVQKCLSSGVPVFCYDRFGGPGWISQKNIHSAEIHNFSGRCCNQKLSGASITNEIISGYEAAVSEAGANREFATEKYSLSTNLSSIIQRLDSTSTHDKPIKNSTLRKLTQIYLQEKYAIAIPSIANIGAESDSHSLLKLVYVPENESDRNGLLAYWGINPLSGKIFSIKSVITIAGVALSADNNNVISKVALTINESEVETAKLNCPSPGIGKHFSGLENSANSGFSFSLGPDLRAGVYSLVVSLNQGNRCVVGKLEISRLTGSLTAH